MDTFYGIWSLFLGRMGGIASGVPGGTLMGAGGTLGAEEKEGGGKGAKGAAFAPFPPLLFLPSRFSYLPSSQTFPRISKIPQTFKTVLEV